MSGGAGVAGRQFRDPSVLFRIKDTFDTISALRAAGNQDGELQILPTGNHSFQFDVEDYETRVQEKSPCRTSPAKSIRFTRPSSSTTWREDSPNPAAGPDSTTYAGRSAADHPKNNPH